MRRTLPILAIVLFATAACNGGAAPRAAVSRPDTIANQAAPAAGQQPGPIDESSTALASLPASAPNQSPRSVVLAAPGAVGADRASTILDSRLLRDAQVRDVYEVVDATYHQGAPPPSLPSGE